jgi:hypothetical protein
MNPARVTVGVRVAVRVGVRVAVEEALGLLGVPVGVAGVRVGDGVAVFSPPPVGVSVAVRVPVGVVTTGVLLGAMVMVGSA